MADQSPIQSAIQQIADEKGISVEAIVAAIEAALAAAYRKDFGQKNQNIRVTFNLETATAKAFDVKIVVPDELVEEARAREREALANATETRPVTEPPAGAAEGEAAVEEKRFNPKTDIGVSEAQRLKTGAVVGEELWTPLDIPNEYGRMAAQTAKQVIMQKLREAEHTNIYEQFKGKEQHVVTAVVQRRDSRAVYLDLGRAVGVMPPEEQVPREPYRPGDRLKVYVIAVNVTPKGPAIIVSRAHPELVRQIFAMEIPEITNGLIAVRGIAREAGSRSKVAVAALDQNVDPIGSCVGQRGTRVQTIIGELGGEKIDIIEYSDDPARYLTNALSPAKVLTLETNDALRTAVATVAEDQLSLAIGRGGQNVRLAARLTGWKIDIRSESGDLQPLEPEDGANDRPADASGDGEAASEVPAPAPSVL